MYCNYYGFSEKPFGITPDPRFLFLTPDHRKALGSIVYGIRERRGFITIVGEAGTGKTTLLNAAMDQLDVTTRTAFIFNTDVTFNEILNMALYEWGFKDNENLSKLNAIKCLNRFAIEQLAGGGNVVLILDEAQNLNSNVIEELRLLSNLETRRHKLIQIVLSGQPELETKLSRHELRQFEQRINIRSYIFPLNEKNAYAYLEHRLKVVKNSGAFPFTPEANKLIWEHTEGIPRKINNLCDYSLFIGYRLNKKKINSTVVCETIQHLKLDQLPDNKTSIDVFCEENTNIIGIETKSPRQFIKYMTTMMITGIIIFIGSFFMNSKGFHLAKLSHFISGKKGTVLQTVPMDPTKRQRQVQISRLEIPEHEITAFKILSRKVPKENLEPKTWAKNKEVSYPPDSKYSFVVEKSSELIFNDNEAQNMWQEIASNNNASSQLFKKPEIKEVEKTKLNKTQNRILPFRYTVYLHYSREENTKLMEEIVIFLKNKGFVVNGIERVEYKKRDIRYFHDEDRSGALLLKKDLTPFINTYFKKTNIKIVNLSDKYPNAKKGALELWLTF